MTAPAADHTAPPGEVSIRFLDEAVAGLSSTPKRLPSKYFYDRRGSALFEQICELDEYYLTRTELAIMRRHIRDIAELLGPRVLLIEPGSGASIKVRLLLTHLPDVAGYVPVDISGEHLMRWAHLLGWELPALPILPVHADFLEPFELPPMPSARRRVIYFPGSTIGNFAPDQATAWLARMAKVAGPGGGLLIGVDLKKDAAILEAAYNDRQGVTRAFNLNMLKRMRNELDADIRVDRFEHHAFYNEAEGRIEMHLVSTERQTVCLNHTKVQFEAGETIHTENSYKYGLEQFRELAADAGWRRVTYWTDENEYFGVQYCER
ncbi:MAG: L-histidine N(alpha)-methyltransferase [Planctomycetota bacterium]|jgi:dimethylhistidine N-methyltransferase